MTNRTLTPEARQQIEEALNTGHDAAAQVASEFSASMRGYRPHRHKALADDVAQIKAALAVLAALPQAQAWQDIEPVTFPQASVVKREFIERVQLEHDSDLSPDLRGWSVKQFGPANEACSRQFVVIERAATPSALPAEAVDAKRLNGYGCVKPDTDKQVFFYEQDFYVLSNFSAFTLMWRGFRFDTSEAAYHYEKFDYENPFAYPIAQDIRSAPSAHEAFKIAERNKQFRRDDWDAIKVGVMRSILLAKVSQHEYVRRKLLATGDRELIEDSWRDDFWGWGPNRDGQNMLGKLWMEIRAELRAAQENQP